MPSENIYGSHTQSTKFLIGEILGEPAEFNNATSYALSSGQARAYVLL